jgi:hypothetical protein
VSAWAVDYLYALYEDGNIEKCQNEYVRLLQAGDLTSAEKSEVEKKLLGSKTVEQIALQNQIWYLLIKLDCDMSDDLLGKEIGLPKQVLQDVAQKRCFSQMVLAVLTAFCGKQKSS